jgi:DNA-directed RNA polymerase I, II, and III subunit RPABC2
MASQDEFDYDDDSNQPEPEYEEEDVGEDVGEDEDAENDEETEKKQSAAGLGDEVVDESDDEEDLITSDSDEEEGIAADAAATTDLLDSDDDYDVEDIGNEYVDYQKNLSKELIETYHHESKIHNYTEVVAMSCVKRDSNGVIEDELHQTIPMLSKFEKARVIGMRMKQLNAGADAFVDVPSDMMNTRVIAEMELAQKKLPFIIRRPLPSGASEYWKVSDLMVC